MSCNGETLRRHLHLVLPEGVVVHTVVTVTGTVVGPVTGVVTGGAVGVGAGTVVGVGAGEVGEGDGVEVTGTVVAVLVEPGEVLEVPPVEAVPGDDEPGDDERPTFERVAPLEV